MPRQRDAGIGGGRFAAAGIRGEVPQPNKLVGTGSAAADGDLPENFLRQLKHVGIKLRWADGSPISRCDLG
jgi:hypothetical protein